MKKIGLTACILACFTSSSYAVAPQHKYYVGGELQRAFMSYGPFLDSLTDNGARGIIKKQFTGGGAFVGARRDNMALELGVSLFEHKNYSGTFTDFGTTEAGSLKQKQHNVYVDGVFFYPVHKHVELKGIVGVGALTTKFKGLDGLAHVTGTHPVTGLRLGAGVQYNINSNWFTSLSYKYQWGGLIFKDMQTAALALGYCF